MLYGAGNGHLAMIRSLYPKLRIVARDNVVRILGDEGEMDTFAEALERMRRHILKYNTLRDEDIVRIIGGDPTGEGDDDGAIVYNTSGKPVKARTHNQHRMVEAFGTHDMLFAVGPAGTGKTYLSIALAVRALKGKKVRRIVLSRPAVEAGEKLGYLPGDMREKVDPYLRPLYDALEDMIPSAKLEDMIGRDIIQIAPLAFMRGRTLSDAVVILDEAQNTTPAQIRMFLTRMGWNTKMIITGDTTQIDLPHDRRSGLVEALDVLDGVPGIDIIRLNDKDIVRHRLVTKIVNAYKDYDNKTNRQEQ